MATTAQRRLQPKETRRFGSLRSPYSIPDLTEIQTRSYEVFLQYETPAAEAEGPGDRRRAAGNLPRRKLRQDPAAGIYPLRTGQAALRAGRVPPTAADLRPALQGLAPPDQGAADRGGSLPRRHPHHARRRRVHHQRGRAGGGQPTPPQPRRRLRQRNGRHRRAPPAKLPHHSRTRKLDRTERQPQGKPLGPHRPERQVLDHDAAAGDGPAVQRQRQPAAGVLSDGSREDRRQPQRGEDRRETGRRRRGVSGRQPAGRRDSRRMCPEDHEERRRDDLHLRPEADRGDGRAEESAADQRPGRRQHGQPRRGPAADLSAAASRQPAAVGEGQGPLPREVLRHQPLPAGPRGPLPHQPQAGPEHRRRRR